MSEQLTIEDDADAIEEAISFLNEINSLDENMLLKLINLRIRCNQKIANHRTIQVRVESMGRIFDVSILGIINGIFGIHPETKYGHITMDCETDKDNPWIVTKINKFRLTGHLAILDNQCSEKF